MGCPPVGTGRMACSYSTQEASHGELTQFSPDCSTKQNLAGRYAEVFSRRRHYFHALPGVTRNRTPENAASRCHWQRDSNWRHCTGPGAFTAKSCHPDELRNYYELPALLCPYDKPLVRCRHGRSAGI